MILIVQPAVQAPDGRHPSRGNIQRRGNLWAPRPAGLQRQEAGHQLQAVEQAVIGFLAKQLQPSGAAAESLEFLRLAGQLGA